MPLPTVLKPFIPDMVPAHPDVDAMIKVAMILTISQSAVITLSSKRYGKYVIYVRNGD